MHPARWYVHTCEPGQSPGRCPTVGTGEDEPPGGPPRSTGPTAEPNSQQTRTNQSEQDCGVLRPPGRLLPRPLDPPPPPPPWWCLTVVGGGEGWSLLSFRNTRGHVEVMCVNRVSGDLRVKRGNQGSRVWTGWMPHASWYSISFLPSLACLLQP